MILLADFGLSPANYLGQTDEVYFPRTLGIFPSKFFYWSTLEAYQFFALIQ
jgi:hypothetical protein